MSMKLITKLLNTLRWQPCCGRNLRMLSTSRRLNAKVAVCGASGGVGQALSLLLKVSPLVEELALYDINLCEGVTADLSHINTNIKTTAFSKSSVLQEAVENKDIIVITAGKSRDPGMKRTDLFKINADIIKSVAEAMSKSAPQAMLCIVTNPINSLMPIAATVLKKAKVYDGKKLFGVTTLDCVRASSFAAELMCYDSSSLVIPVIGGHSGLTIVPVLSQASKPIDLPKDKMKALIDRIQNGGDEILEAKGGKGSATLSTGFSAARFVFALCRAIKGEGNQVECAMVESDLTDAQFFSTPLLLGPMGVKKNLGYGKLSADECCLMSSAVEQLIKDIEMGTQYMQSNTKDKAKCK